MRLLFAFIICVGSLAISSLTFAGPGTPLTQNTSLASPQIQNVKFFKPEELALTGNGSFETQAMAASQKFVVGAADRKSAAGCSMFYTSHAGHFLSAAHCLDPCLNPIRRDLPLRALSPHISIRDYPADLPAQLQSCLIVVDGRRPVQLLALGSKGDIELKDDGTLLSSQETALYYSLVRQGYGHGGDTALFRDASHHSENCIPVSLEPPRKKERMLVMGYPSATQWEGGYNSNGSSERIAVAYPSCGLKQNTDLLEFQNKESQSMVALLGRKLYPNPEHLELLKTYLKLNDELPTHQAITAHLVKGSSGGGVFSTERHSAIGIVSFITNLYGPLNDYISQVHDSENGSYFLKMEQVHNVLQPKLAPREFQSAFDCR